MSAPAALLENSAKNLPYEHHSKTFDQFSHKVQRKTMKLLGT